MNPEPAPATTPPKGLTPVPDPVNPDGLTLIRPWVNGGTIGITPIALVAAWFTYKLFGLTQGAAPTSPVLWIPYVFGAATAIFWYILAVRYVNRTRIEIAPTHVALRNGPLPWRKDRRVEAAEVRRFLVRRITVSYGGNSGVFHEVWLEDVHGTERALIEGEMDQAEARFIEGECARILGRPATPSVSGTSDTSAGVGARAA